MTLHLHASARLLSNNALVFVLKNTQRFKPISMEARTTPAHNLRDSLSVGTSPITPSGSSAASKLCSHMSPKNVSAMINAIHRARGNPFNASTDETISAKATSVENAAFQPLGTTSAGTWELFNRKTSATML